MYLPYFLTKINLNGMSKSFGIGFKSAVFAMCVLVSTATFATDRTICSSGCDYSNIQAAINAANAGDVIVIKAGTFTESVTEGILINKNLTIRGETSATTIIQAHATKGSAVNRVFRVTSGTVLFGELNYSKRQAGLWFTNGGRGCFYRWSRNSCYF